MYDYLNEVTWTQRRGKKVKVSTLTKERCTSLLNMVRRSQMPVDTQGQVVYTTLLTMALVQRLQHCVERERIYEEVMAEEQWGSS